jgi:2-dehydropantoate 2-reductase
MIPIQPRYLIIGAGAVGLGLAAVLCRAGHRVAIAARGAVAEALRTDGLRLEGILGQFQSAPFAIDVMSDLAEFGALPPAIVFVCVKSFDSAAVAEQLAALPAMHRSAIPIVLCQNGWGNAEIFAERFPALQILNACLVTGFKKTTPTTVLVTVHARPVRIDGLAGTGPEALVAAEAISAGGLPAKVTTRIARDLWDKMCFNCVVNPLGALYDCTLGELAANLTLRSIICRLVRELYEVMAANEYEATVPTAAEYLQQLFGKVLPATASHHPSMWHDLRAGRRTEIEALNGQVIRLARLANVPVPANRSVFEAIQSCGLVPNNRPRARIHDACHRLPGHAFISSVQSIYSRIVSSENRRGRVLKGLDQCGVR